MAHLDRWFTQKGDFPVRYVKQPEGITLIYINNILNILKLTTKDHLFDPWKEQSTIPSSWVPDVPSASFCWQIINSTRTGTRKKM